MRYPDTIGTQRVYTAKDRSVYFGCTGSLSGTQSACGDEQAGIESVRTGSTLFKRCEEGFEGRQRYGERHTGAQGL